MLLFTEEGFLMSTGQISELRKATLGWVLCNNLQFFDVQSDVFRVAGPE